MNDTADLTQLVRHDGIIAVNVDSLFLAIAEKQPIRENWFPGESEYKHGQRIACPQTLPAVYALESFLHRLRQEAKINLVFYFIRELKRAWVDHSPFSKAFYIVLAEHLKLIVPSEQIFEISMEDELPHTVQQATCMALFLHQQSPRLVRSEHICSNVPAIIEEYAIRFSETEAMPMFSLILDPEQAGYIDISHPHNGIFVFLFRQGKHHEVYTEHKKATKLLETSSKLDAESWVEIFRQTVSDLHENHKDLTETLKDQHINVSAMVTKMAACNATLTLWANSMDWIDVRPINEAKLACCKAFILETVLSQAVPLQWRTQILSCSLGSIEWPFSKENILQVNVFQSFVEETLNLAVEPFSEYLSEDTDSRFFEVHEVTAVQNIVHDLFDYRFVRTLLAILSFFNTSEDTIEELLCEEIPSGCIACTKYLWDCLEPFHLRKHAQFLPLTVDFEKGPGDLGTLQRQDEPLFLDGVISLKEKPELQLRQVITSVQEQKDIASETNYDCDLDVLPSTPSAMNNFIKVLYRIIDHDAYSLEGVETDLLTQSDGARSSFETKDSNFKSAHQSVQELVERISRKNAGEQLKNLVNTDATAFACEDQNEKNKLAKIFRSICIHCAENLLYERRVVHPSLQLDLTTILLPLLEKEYPAQYYLISVLRSECLFSILETLPEDQRGQELVKLLATVFARKPLHPLSVFDEPDKLLDPAQDLQQSILDQFNRYEDRTLTLYFQSFKTAVYNHFSLGPRGQLLELNKLPSSGLHVPLSPEMGDIRQHTLLQLAKKFDRTPAISTVISKFWENVIEKTFDRPSVVTASPVSKFRTLSEYVWALSAPSLLRSPFFVIAGRPDNFSNLADFYDSISSEFHIEAMGIPVISNFTQPLSNYVVDYYDCKDDMQKLSVDQKQNLANFLQSMKVLRTFAKIRLNWLKQKAQQLEPTDQTETFLQTLERVIQDFESSLSKE